MRTVRTYPEGYWEEHKTKSYWVELRRRDFDRVTNNVYHGKYQDLLDHLKKWRDHTSNVCDDNGNWLHYPGDYTDDECCGYALSCLQIVLESRIKILRKVANLYRAHRLEDMTVEARWDFVRPQLGWAHYTTEHTEQHLIEYPRHLLHVQRFKKTTQWNSST